MAVEEVVVALAPKASAKGLELVCQIDPDLSMRVRGDDDRLRQILMNIINNAIKFTARGEVIVRASTVAPPNSIALHSDAMTVKFSVTDTGTGIPPERMHRLFKSFSQVDSSVTRQYGGTGLGLAISKQLVELMGGEIGVESEPGKGSTFWFTIRLASQEIATQTTIESQLSLTSCRVLVVDDSVTQCQVLQEQLGVWGIKAQSADSAEAGLGLMKDAAASGQPFDVAIIDLNMPGMSGMEMAKTIRESSELSLILMSGIENISAVEQQNVGQFLTKPIRQSNLLDAIMKARLKPHSTGRHPDAMAAAAPTTPPTTSSSASTPLRILLAEDVDVNQLVVTETLGRAGYGCKIANNGREAVAAVAAETFDLIFMDCQMPEMSGFEATAAIREWEKTHGDGQRRIKIIALTANAVKGDREQCLAAGMDDYITKPLKPELLIACLKACAPAVSMPAALALAANPAQTNEPAPAKQSAIDIAELRTRCDGDEGMMSRLIQLFHQKSGRTWNELLASYEAGDASGTAKLAHSLKGSAANLSATKVSSLAAKLEELGRSDNLAAAESVMSALGIELQHCRTVLAGLCNPGASTDSSAAAGKTTV
jgi:CheY-like chemotaxis protein/HPt (histidine-containing phosphotransfer) domain-containing protein